MRLTLFAKTTRMLEAVRDQAPAVYPMVHSAYSTPSFLFGGDHTIISTEGVQQGDPLGPLYFSVCLSIATAPV